MFLDSKKRPHNVLRQTGRGGMRIRGAKVPAQDGLPAVSTRAWNRNFLPAALRGWWVISQACQGGQGSAGGEDRNYTYQALRSR